ncbi:MAG: hypothetical protein HRT87_06785 [Legionellales bacterium]|nr:hypothetical protein [Legionellales bacterium]
MAKIFVSHFAPINSFDYTTYIPSYYEGFISTLLASGNEVLHMQSTDFIVSPWNGKNIYKASVDRKITEKKISNFNPDIAFIFNNSTVPDLYKLLDCPIIIMRADSPLYYNDKEDLKKNSSKYFFCYSNEEELNEIQDYFNCKTERLIKSIFATAFKNISLEKTHPISFIGNNFLPNTGKLSLTDDEVSREIRKYSGSFINIHENHPTEIFKISNIKKNTLSSENTRSFLVGHERRKTLEILVDLGLILYGKNWDNIIDSSVELSLAYRNTKIVSLAHNQDIYNSSKICINISHPQSKFSFPWRVLDIAATSGCLVSDPRRDIIDFFRDYVKIPIYSNRYEARKICKKLLSDSIYREEIVTNCNICIEDKGRFEHRLSEFQDFFGVTLLQDIPCNKVHKNSIQIAENNSENTAILEINQLSSNKYYHCLHDSKKIYFKIISKLISTLRIQYLFKFIFKILLKIIPYKLLVKLYKFANYLRLPIGSLHFVEKCKKHRKD